MPRKGDIMQFRKKEIGQKRIVPVGRITGYCRALWSPAGKGLTFWLSFVVSAVSLSLSYWYPGSGVVLDCIDS